MKNKTSYRFLFLLAISLFFTLCTTAQEETTTTVTIDTLPPGVEDAPKEEYTTTDNEEPFYPDTLVNLFRTITADTVDVINKDKGFYYKRYLDSLLRASQPKPTPPEKPKKNRGGFSVYDSFFGLVFWILAIALFGFLVYRLFLSNSSIFSRNRKNVTSDIKVTTEENTGDTEVLLNNAIKSGNYRLAIRYLYLQTLERLADKKFIHVNSNKTNYEYVNEVRKHSFANDFASLTLKYEYVWYGEYPVDASLFNQLKNDFTQFNKNNVR